MEEVEIINSVVKYLFNNHYMFEGSMLKFDSYKLTGNTLEDYSRSDSKLAFGYPADIIADSIERDYFFGYHVPKDFSHSSDFLNAKLIQLPMYYKINEGGILIRGTVEPKGYLDGIKSKTGFIEAVQAIGYKRNVSKIVSKIFEKEIKKPQLGFEPRTSTFLE